MSGRFGRVPMRVQSCHYLTPCDISSLSLYSGDDSFVIGKILKFRRALFGSFQLFSVTGHGRRKQHPGKEP